MPKKSMTIEDLAILMKKNFTESDKKTNERFTESDKKSDKRIEDLARMTQRGFLEMGDRFDKVGKDIKELKDGQEQIKLRLDNVAYRFELVALQKRVEFLEKKHGIPHR